MQAPSGLRRAALVLLAAALLVAAWTPWLDTEARAETQAGLGRALTTFAGARALGAALSVAEGTELSLEPLGIGVTLAPGQALRPINELVDKFADVMLVASVAFGVQLLVLQIGGHMAVSAFLTVALLAWLVLAWRGPGGRAGRWIQPLLLLVLLVRFAVPAGAVANEAIYRAFLHQEYDAAYAALQGSAAQVPGNLSQPPGGEGGVMDRLRALQGKFDEIQAGYKRLLEQAGQWSDRIVRLIAIFVLQTVLLPLLFLWISWRLARALAMAPWRAPREAGPQAP